jgi:hypothetical protein
MAHSAYGFARRAGSRREAWWHEFGSWRQVVAEQTTKVAMHRNAFGVLLDQCLKVTPDDHLLVIYDGSLSPYHEGLSQALRERSLFPTEVFLP